MRKLLCLIGLLALQPAPATPHPGYSDADRKADDALEASYAANLRNEISSAIAGRNYAKLDALQRHLVKTRRMTRDGYWSLESYHFLLFNILTAGLDQATGCTFRHPNFTDEWMRAFPTSSAAILTHAELKMAEGWCFRGNGYASEVKKENWPKFYQSFMEAYDTLTLNSRMRTEDPEYYCKLLDILIGIGASYSEFSKVFDEAVTREPYYYAIYRNASRYFLPQWHGNILAYEAFARRVAALTPRDGDRLYAELAYWNVSDEDPSVINPGFDWQRVKKGSHEFFERYSSERNWFFFMKAACRYGDTEGGRQFIRDRFQGEDDRSLIIWFTNCDLMAREAEAMRKRRADRPKL